jgi:hypothetical protein
MGIGPKPDHSIVMPAFNDLTKRDDTDFVPAGPTSGTAVMLRNWNSAGGSKLDPITSHLYADQETAALPDAAVQASLAAAIRRSWCRWLEEKLT